MSKKDKKNVAKMGKSLEAYYDKRLGKWVFPGGEGDQGGGEQQDSGPPPSMSNGMRSGMTVGDNNECDENNIMYPFQCHFLARPWL